MEQAADHCERQRHGVTSLAILEWTNRTGVDWLYIAPGKPKQNGFVESFSDKLRDECLNQEIFGSLAEARTGRRRVTTHR